MLYRLTTPLKNSDIVKLKIGDKILLSGIIYIARDSAHKRLVDSIRKGKRLPFDIEGSVIYYCGPSPAKPGMVIGSAGPTTSCRMDPFTPLLLERGLKGMIGKGPRSRRVIDSIVKNKSLYFAALGGAGALISQYIKASQIIAYKDLGPEAIRRLEVEEMPLVVINDTRGKDLYRIGWKKFKRKEK
ncbi:Fe-S-containing hydro-lyase [bacterium]|nr:Fe-S-containing hydro-lyase [bacterium]MBU4561133.1 Fe-S-containing hydro-lyase [bacterium]MCG2675857.1 Fe-S-containing hydro-lyase [bacterium]MCG2677925.1 Fe-S-containing hydro-lyase [bacterium]